MNTQPDNSTKSGMSALKLAVVTIAAFAAAWLFRPSAGIVSMIPFAVLLTALTAFVRLPLWSKASLYGITVFILNDVEKGDLMLSLLRAGLCVVFCVIFEYSAKKYAKHKKAGIALLLASSIVSVALSFLLTGNPIKAYLASERINEYTEKHYPSEKDGSKTGFDVSRIYYNLALDSYMVDIVSADSPTETGTVSLSGDYIDDGFADILEFNLMNAHRNELTAALRASLPDAVFSVTQDSIAGYPGKSGGETGDALAKLMSFTIHLGGVSDIDSFRTKLALFVEVIEDSKLAYSEITFTAGSGNWHLLACDIRYDHLIRRAKTEVYLLNANKPEIFGNYAEMLNFASMPKR